MPKLQMNENLYKNVNENMFSFTFLFKISTSFSDGPLKQQICYSFTLQISYMFYNPFELLDSIKFSQF